MPDALFAHPRLALIYDAFEGHRGDLAAYLGIVNGLALAVLLAGSGRTVMGIDPAGASLEVAKSKDKAAAISWVHGDAANVPAFGADLAVMTGNVAQVFLTGEDWAQALRAIHAALRPHGHLVFETRRPERRAWEEWAADTGPLVLDVPGSGPVEQRREVTRVSLPFVSFRGTYTFLADGAVVTSEASLSAMGPLDATAIQQGLSAA